MKSAPGIGLSDLTQTAFSFSRENAGNKCLPLKAVSGKPCPIKW